MPTNTIASMIRCDVSRAVLLSAISQRIAALSPAVAAGTSAQIAALDLAHCAFLADAGLFADAEARFYRVATALSLLAH